MQDARELARRALACDSADEVRALVIEDRPWSRRRVVTVTLNPAIDQTLSIPGFAVGQVNRVAESRSDAGGKGVNVASFLADLGLPAIAHRIPRRRQRSVRSKTSFQGKRIEDRFVRIAGSTRTGIKIVDGRQTTDINFPGLSPTPDDLAELNGRIAGLAEPGRWFVLSGQRPAGVPAGVYASMIESIQTGADTSLWTPAVRALREALASQPEAVKPNVEELERADRSQARRRGGLPPETLGVRSGCRLHGRRRRLFVDGGRRVARTASKVEVRSTVGAGDAMVAGIVYGHDSRAASGRGRPLRHGVWRLRRDPDRSGHRGDPDEHRELMSRVEIERL